MCQGAGVIIEHRVFRLVGGVDEQTFLDADRRFQTEVAVFLPGFVRRTTALAADGRWLVETFWASEEDAVAAERLDDDVSTAFRAQIEPASERVERYATLD